MLFESEIKNYNYFVSNYKNYNLVEIELNKNYDFINSTIDFVIKKENKIVFKNGIPNCEKIIVDKNLKVYCYLNSVKFEIPNTVKCYKMYYFIFILLIILILLIFYIIYKRK